MGFPAAYALARYRFPRRQAFETAIMMPLVLPAAVLSIALALLFSRVGFTAGMPRLIAAHVNSCAPYVVRVALPVIQRLDVALEERRRRPGRLAGGHLRPRHSSAIHSGAIAATTLAFVVSFTEIVLCRGMEGSRQEGAVAMMVGCRQVSHSAVPEPCQQQTSGRHWTPSVTSELSQP